MVLKRVSSDDGIAVVRLNGNLVSVCRDVSFRTRGDSIIMVNGREEYDLGEVVSFAGGGHVTAAELRRSHGERLINDLMG
jgi:hypothetical protein